MSVSKWDGIVNLLIPRQQFKVKLEERWNFHKDQEDRLSFHIGKWSPPSSLVYCHVELRYYFQRYLDVSIIVFERPINRFRRLDTLPNDVRAELLLWSKFVLQSVSRQCKRSGSREILYPRGRRVHEIDHQAYMGLDNFLQHAWYLGIKQLPPLHMFHPTSHGSQCHTSIVSYSPRAHQAFLPMWREALWAWWVAWTYWKARSHLGRERRIVKTLSPPVWLLDLAVYHVLWKADTAIQFTCRSRSETVSTVCLPKVQ